MRSSGLRFEAPSGITVVWYDYCGGLACMAKANIGFLAIPKRQFLA